MKKNLNVWLPLPHLTHGLPETWERHDCQTTGLTGVYWKYHCQQKWPDEFWGVQIDTLFWHTLNDTNLNGASCCRQIMILHTPLKQPQSFRRQTNVIFNYGQTWLSGFLFNYKTEGTETTEGCHGVYWWYHCKQWPGKGQTKPLEGVNSASGNVNRCECIKCNCVKPQS